MTYGHKSIISQSAPPVQSRVAAYLGDIVVQDGPSHVSKRRPHAERCIPRDRGGETTSAWLLLQYAAGIVFFIVGIVSCCSHYTLQLINTHVCVCKYWASDNGRVS